MAKTGCFVLVLVFVLVLESKALYYLNFEDRSRQIKASQIGPDANNTSDWSAKKYVAQGEPLVNAKSWQSELLGYFFILYRYLEDAATFCRDSGNDNYLNNQYNPFTWNLQNSLIFTSYSYHVVKAFAIDHKGVELQEQVPGEERVAKKEDQLVWKMLMAGQTAP